MAEVNASLATSFAPLKAEGVGGKTTGVSFEAHKASHPQLGYKYVRLVSGNLPTPTIKLLTAASTSIDSTGNVAHASTEVVVEFSNSVAVPHIPKGGLVSMQGVGTALNRQGATVPFRSISMTYDAPSNTIILDAEYALVMRLDYDYTYALVSIAHRGGPVGKAPFESASIVAVESSSGLTAIYTSPAFEPLESYGGLPPLATTKGTGSGAGVITPSRFVHDTASSTMSLVSYIDVVASSLVSAKASNTLAVVKYLGQTDRELDESFVAENTSRFTLSNTPNDTALGLPKTVYAGSMTNMNGGQMSPVIAVGGDVIQIGSWLPPSEAEGATKRYIITSATTLKLNEIALLYDGVALPMTGQLRVSYQYTVQSWVYTLPLPASSSISSETVIFSSSITGATGNYTISAPDNNPSS